LTSREILVYREREGRLNAMPRTKTSARGRPAKPSNRRGSPEAVEKRRVARLFNDVLTGRGAVTVKLDGRTEKRRQRLLAELESGTRGQRALKPIEILQHAQELLEMGETLASLRKVARPKKLALPPDGLGEVVERLHQAYGFRLEAYRFLGLADEVLVDAGVLERTAERKARPRRRA
jgi:hypothetical protein